MSANEKRGALSLLRFALLGSAHRILSDHLRTRGKSPWILSRTACLGNDLTQMAFPGALVVNRQKLRVDGLRELVSSTSTRYRNPLNLLSLLANPTMWPLLEQQKRVLNVRKIPPPSLILIDSYSELTDQKFVETKTGEVFFMNFSDVSKQALQELKVESLGLLGEIEIESLWRETLRILTDLWGTTPIVFVLYPTFRERRNFWLSRAAAIERSVRALAKEFDTVKIIKLEDAEVASAERGAKGSNVMEDSFPYHYPSWVYEVLANRLHAVTARLGFEAAADSSEF